MSTDRPLDLTLGVTGGSGAGFAAAALRALAGHPRVGQVRLVFSDHVWDNLRAECGEADAGVEALRERFLAVPEGREKITVHDVRDMAAPISSGSHRSDGMVVLPCSMSSLAAIANGTSSTLTHRAADVTLKQCRKLLLCVRESPYNLVHLENMVRAARAGAVIVPVTVLLYQRPTGVDDIIRLYVGRVLDLLGLDPADMPRWQGLPRNS
jgi:4-hydroxy-3-polyprenylbenzoate decarboxylase